MKVACVIVNYRTATLTLHALEAVLHELDALGGRALVVDNDSGDDAYATICEAVVRNGWDDRVDVFASPRNGGFGAGNNLAIAHAMEWASPPDYVYLLNPDARPDAGAVRSLVEFMDGRADVGIAGSQLRRPGGALHPSAFRFPSLLSEVEHGLRLGIASRLLDRWRVSLPIPARTCRVDWVSGASMMLRCSMLEQIGWFDENFFLYFEETDVALRAAKAGWATMHVADSRVEHIGHASTGMDGTRRCPTYWFESRAYYLQKHYGRRMRFAANVAFAGARIVPELRNAMGRSHDDPPHLSRDFVAFNFGRS